MGTTSENEKLPESASHGDKVETSRNWCDLPGTALISIVTHLDPHTNLTRLRAVCPEWRTSLPISSFPNLTSIPLPPLEPNRGNRRPLSLLINRFCLLSPLPSNQDGRWLARMTQLGHNRWHLHNPFNIHEYFFSDPPVTGSINLIDCQVKKLEIVFSLVDDGPEAKPLTKKIVGGMTKDSTCQHFTVLGQLERDNGRDLVLYRLGNPHWTRIEETKNLHIVDIAFHDGMFYAFDVRNWRVGLIDPGNPLSPMEFISAPDILEDDDKFTLKFDDCSYSLRGLHLVPSSFNDRLYLVLEVERQSEPEKVSLIVFVLTENENENENDNNKWEHVKSLGDQIFFIGYDTSFSLPKSSVNLPQWKPGSICLFTWPFPLIFDGCYKDLSGGMPEGAELLESVTYAEYWRYLRMFVLEEEEEEEEDKNHQERVVVPFKTLPKGQYTGLFFPPPAWVKWQCPSLDNLEVRLDGLKFRDLN